MSKPIPIPQKLIDVRKPHDASVTPATRPPRTKPPLFVLVGFGNLRFKIFHHLYTFWKERLIDLAVIDLQKRHEEIKAWTPDEFFRETGLDQLKPPVLGEERKRTHKELKNLFWSVDQPDSLTLSPRLRALLEARLDTGRRPTLFYIALHPDKYPSEVVRYAKYAKLIALEKPLAPYGADAGELITLLEQMGKLENEVAVDHSLFKPTILLIDKFLRGPSLKHLIDYSDSI